jgi:hypothetical protein
MFPADVYIQDGIAMVRMRPVDWCATHAEQVFTACPKEQTNVSLTAFCAMCPHYKGLAVPEIGRLAVRLEREEITEGMFKDDSTRVLQRASSVAVVCAYPVLRECGSFKGVSTDASPESD